MKSQLNLVLALAALLLVALAVGCPRQPGQSGTGSTATTTSGKPAGSGHWGSATDISFTTFDGQSKHLSDYAGQPLVLNFWAAW